MKRSFIIEIISGSLILLFVYAAVSKLTGFNHFKAILSVSPVIGQKAAILAWALPVAELIIASLLFIPKTRLPGIWLSLILLIVFTGYLIYMIKVDHNLPCSCGGVIGKMTWKEHIVFNLFFIFLSITGIFLSKGKGRNTEKLVINAIPP